MADGPVRQMADLEGRKVGFAVAGFWSAVGGALIYSVISWGLSALLLRK